MESAVHLLSTLVIFGAEAIPAVPCVHTLHVLT